MNCHYKLTLSSVSEEYPGNASGGIQLLTLMRKSGVDLGIPSASAMLAYESKEDLNPKIIDQLLYCTANNVRLTKADSGGWVVGCVVQEQNLLKVAEALGYDDSPKLVQQSFESRGYDWYKISEPEKYNRFQGETLEGDRIFGIKIEELSLENLNEALYNFPFIPDRMKEDD